MDKNVLKTLTPIEENVIQLRFFKRYLLREVCEQLGFTLERIRQIEYKALRKILEDYYDQDKSRQ